MAAWSIQEVPEAEGQRMNGVGYMDLLVARRESAIRGLSDTAKHLAFPSLYRRPEKDAAVLLAKPLPKSINVIAEPTLPKRRPAKQRAEEARVEINRIIAICAWRWQVEPADILCRSREAKYTKPRLAAMKLVRECLKLPTSTVGWAIGRRDHTTVVSGCQRALFWIETNPDYRARYEAAERSISSAPLSPIGVPLGSSERARPSASPMVAAR